MPITKKPLKRYNILDACFSNTGRNYTFDDLKEAIDQWMRDKYPGASGISTRQLREDIAFMKSTDGWEAPIVTIPGNGRKRYYRYEDPSFTISNQPINKAQIEELKTLLETLDLFDGLPQFKGIEDLMIKLQSDLDIVQGRREIKLIDWGDNPYYEGRHHLSALYNAVSERLQVEMTYSPFGRESKTFVTNPLFIKRYNNRWFLVSKLEQNGFVYINAFDRIDNIQVLNSQIPCNMTFDAEDYFDPVIGVSRPKNGQVEQLEIQLTPETYPYIKTKPLHHSQRNYDSDFRIVISVIRNKELEMVLKSYGVSDTDVKTLKLSKK